MALSLRGENKIYRRLFPGGLDNGTCWQSSSRSRGAETNPRRDGQMLRLTKNLGSEKNGGFSPSRLYYSFQLFPVAYKMTATNFLHSLFWKDIDDARTVSFFPATIKAPNSAKISRTFCRHSLCWR
uniref:Uncharacterized protein n=1 Tax=Odontella aurita TaxID=265563 RepID=A0A7S4I024_9STRA